MSALPWLVCAAPLVLVEPPLVEVPLREDGVWDLLEALGFDVVWASLPPPLPPTPTISRTATTIAAAIAPSTIAPPLRELAS